MAAQEAQAYGCQRQHRHGDDDLHDPWLEVVRVVARQAGELRLRRRRHWGHDVQLSTADAQQASRVQFTAGRQRSRQREQEEKMDVHYFSQGGQSLFTTSYSGPRVPTKHATRNKWLANADHYCGLCGAPAGIELGLKGVRCNLVNLVSRYKPTSKTHSRQGGCRRTAGSDPG